MVIPRYTPTGYEKFWSQSYKYEIWLLIEKLVCEALEKTKVVPVGTSEELNNIQLDVDQILELEKNTQHDFVAFLNYVQNNISPESSKWVHYGLTSSDVVDTAFSFILKEVIDDIETKLNYLIVELQILAHQHKNTPIIGRSHGIHAEPTTFGRLLEGHLAELCRNRVKLALAKEEISIGKISGAVGTYAHINPQVEEIVLGKLGLKPEMVSTQVIARDRHAFVFLVFALIASAIERFATNIRHLQRTEVGEVREHFGGRQVGSSAMPHKQNPIMSENLCGLARMVKAAVYPALDNISLWHERDISHSSVERFIAPDVTSTLAYMLDKTTFLVKNLVVNNEKMLSNLNLTGGLIYSEAVMLALIKKGMTREAAHNLIKKLALEVSRYHGDFKHSLETNDEVSSLLTSTELEEIFSLKKALQFIQDEIIS